ncbi:MAG: LytTR family DNA-binding domain-containing protein [Bryobacteraceae bacterium]|nr:LytTR family DNA-binding domain-containing protein [Bryobacteraceae bacterium]
MTSALQILIVDDEAPARQRLADLLKANAPIAEASDGRSAVRALQSRAFDLVFLDIQMPELDGLSVVTEVGFAAMPLTVFVTAYDQYAIRAFEANALDYLLKPFSDERFEATLQRVMRRKADDAAGQMQRLFAGFSAHTPVLHRFVVKSSGVTRFIDAAEIDWIEAAGVYVTLHIGSRTILHSGFTLAELEAKLDQRKFVRVHRSAIVQLDRIAHLEPISHGEFAVLLKGGDRLRLSRTYRPKLERLLGQSL